MYTEGIEMKMLQKQNSACFLLQPPGTAGMSVNSSYG